MIIESREKLEEWLDQNNWFEDGYVSTIEGEPNIALKITIGYQVEGTYVAGEYQKLIEYDIHPFNVSKWTYSSSHAFSPSREWCIEGIDLIEEGFGLKFDTPYTFEIVCSSLEVSEPKSIEGYTQPWTSDSEVFIEAPHKEVPTPDYWIDELRKRGYSVSFRYYSGTAKGVDELPYPDYSGYYIQSTGRVKQSQEGVFFKCITDENCKLRITLELKDEKSAEVWKALLRIVANWEKVKISSGNVVFEGAEWLQFVETGKYPERIEKIKTSGNTVQS
ncbi:hypothetical protein [Pontibacter actiniarum]|uniref:Uncharacterized protein n=1 Tax=Pontibacter actiniarum TaxID=323450 RepID=A0A1X9YS45_9BACT|nr:hypothetical protein [Pontibacter actiniarum]ARS35687.1 hypothetical protein CA264_09675 [Pontibacter actiniarum]